MFTINQEISKHFGCHVDGTRFLGMSYRIISCNNGSSLKTYSFFVFFFWLVLAGEFVVDIRVPAIGVQLVSHFLPHQEF